jgi:hypothetical protein
MIDQARTTAFQPDAFQFDAFQIFDETTIDDGITKTIVPSKFITTALTNHDGITTSKPLPINITS